MHLHPRFSSAFDLLADAVVTVLIFSAIALIGWGALGLLQ